MLIVKYFEYHSWKGLILEPAKGPVAVFTPEGGILLSEIALRESIRRGLPTTHRVPPRTVQSDGSEPDIY